MSENKKLKFPDGFLWGASNSAYQIEGGCVNNWSEWEKVNAGRLAKEARGKWQLWQQEQFPEMFEAQNYISGRACDHYNLYEKDFDSAKELGHNAHRFSLEWSRIEPEEGKFSPEGIEHYRKVLQALRVRGIEPMVTLWHWTNPLWLEKKGGCESRDFAPALARYAQYAVEQLGDLAEFWVTLNEPTAVLAMAYVKGVWPPQKKNPVAVWRVYRHLARAHNLAYDAMHSVSEKFQVGFSHNMFYYEPNNHRSWLDRALVRVIEYFANERFFRMTPGKHDFIGLQYYFHSRFKFPGLLRNDNLDLNDLAWEIYPEGIYHLLKGLQKYNLPIYITENGLADKTDARREKFIKDHLAQVHRAIQEGVNVRGYLYWSLLDNFEWDKGFWPRFGLVAVDYQTLERKIRPSALKYAEICKNNSLDI
ncbi:glycoside hydrolase family 1 protein [Patescibacteria group bacterium]|nr:MAG: glycoside hydrolase family 1 protein [Patescibacteria group bacterium]